MKFKFFKKRLLSFVSIGSVLSLIFLSACSENLPQVENPITINQNFKLTPATDKNKIAIFPSEGDYKNNPINRSITDGLLALTYQLKTYNAFFVEKNDSQSEKSYFDAYDRAISFGYNYWFLIGSKHTPFITKYWESKSVEMSRSNVILVFVNSSIPTTIPEGRAISFNFDVKRPAYIVGYAAAKYISEKAKEKTIKNISTFASSNTSETAQYNQAFLDGVFAYNSQILPDKRVQISQNDISLNAGIFKNKKLQDVVENNINSDTTITLPVAGYGGSQAVVEYYNKHSIPGLVVGVDSNQAVHFPNLKNYFFSSIQSNFAQAAYDIAGDLYTQTTKTIKDFEFIKKSSTLTFSDKFVSYAKSTAPNAKLIDKYLQEGSDFLNSLKKFVTFSDSLNISIFGTDTSFNSDRQTALNKIAKNINKWYDNQDMRPKTPQIYFFYLRNLRITNNLNQ